MQGIWHLLWSVTEQMHGNMESIILLFLYNKEFKAFDGDISYAFVLLIDRRWKPIKMYALLSLLYKIECLIEIIKIK